MFSTIFCWALCLSSEQLMILLLELINMFVISINLTNMKFWLPKMLHISRRMNQIDVKEIAYIDSCTIELQNSLYKLWCLTANITYQPNETSSGWFPLDWSVVSRWKFKVKWSGYSGLDAFWSTVRGKMNFKTPIKIHLAWKRKFI